MKNEKDDLGAVSATEADAVSCSVHADQLLHDAHEAIHGWFELTYAQYLTIPRSALQSMPDEWQSRFVRCLRELDDMIDWRPEDGCYRVELRALRDKKEDGQWVSGWGRLLRDPLRDYQRGRRRIPLKIGSGNPPSDAKRAASTRRSAAK